MLLFVLSTIPLVNSIEEDRNIKWFQRKYNSEIKILAYGDDTTILVGDVGSIAKAFAAYHNYEKALEAKINMQKTEILRLGKWKMNMPE